MISELAYSGIFILGDTTWELIQAYSKTMQEQTARNNALIVPALLVIGISIAAYLLWRKTHPAPPEKGLTAYEMAHSRRAESAKKEPGRDLVRVPVNFKFNYGLIKTGLPGEKIDYVSAQSVDLSGSGISFVTRHEIRTGDSLRIHLELDPGKTLNLSGRVVRATSDNSGENRRWMAAAEFVAAAVRDTESIIQWIFRYQRDTMT
ncbi:MAG: PilZ domain-containing protein [Firmicutes bacterium]|nr:PilZ domain-containing protein [Bacillota bacterium]